MFTPYFYIRNRKEKAGIIYVSFYINREKVNFSTKVECDEKKWDEKKMYVRKTDIDANDKNIILENIRARIINVYVKYRLKDRKLTRELFLKNYNRPADFDTFHDYADLILKQSRNKLEANTYRMHRSVLKKLKEFNSKLHFDDIDAPFLQNYKHYLINTLENNLNTCNKNLVVIKKYIHSAIREGYMETNPFADFSISKTKPNIVFLDDDELGVLWSMYRSKDYLEKHESTLRCFLFMCFGSQHISDARAMKIEQFSEDSFTYYRVKMKNKKPEPVKVPISEPLRILINDIAKERESGYLFKKMPADQTMNEYLKVIAEDAGIQKKISCKTGRHTFATIFLEHNPNIKKLQEILGHSDSKTTMVYVHAMEKYKNAGVECFNKFI